MSGGMSEQMCRLVEDELSEVCRAYREDFGRNTWVYCRLPAGHAGMHVGYTVPGERFWWDDRTSRGYVV